jgi:hypothetical protein
MAQHDTKWHTTNGTIWHAAERDTIWNNTAHDTTRQNMAQHDTWHDMAQHDTTLQNTTQHGTKTLKLKIGDLKM